MKYYIHLLIILLAIGLTGCGPESGEVQIDIEALLAKPKTFVGSDKCEFCHLEHYSSWKNTLHSRTLQDVTENLDALVADIDPLIIRADLKRIEKSLRVPVEKIYIPKINEIKYTLGMQWEQGFLVEKNGTLYVAPIKYSAREEHWIAYQEEDWDRRPWIKKCAGCPLTWKSKASSNQGSAVKPATVQPLTMRLCLRRQFLKNTGQSSTPPICLPVSGPRSAVPATAGANPPK